MGTSTDYSAPPNWGGLKNAVSRAGQKSLTPTKARQLVLDHISNSGGSSRIASGGGQLGTGQTARQIVRSLGGFIQEVGKSGLAQALKSHGLEALVGKSAQETLLGILGLCGGREGSHDSVDARNALSQTMDDLCRDVTTAEEVEAVLTAFTDAGRLAALMISFFGNYVYEQFCRVFFAQLVQKHGERRAESFLGQIADYIRSRLNNLTLGMNLTGVDWFGPPGDQLATQIMQETLAVFEQ